MKGLEGTEYDEKLEIQNLIQATKQVNKTYKCMLIIIYNVWLTHLYGIDYTISIILELTLC